LSRLGFINLGPGGGSGIPACVSAWGLSHDRRGKAAKIPGAGRLTVEGDPSPLFAAVGGGAGCGRLAFRYRETEPAAHVEPARICRESLLLPKIVLDRDNDDVIQLAHCIGCEPAEGAMEVLTDCQSRAAALFGGPSHLAGGAVTQGLSQLCADAAKAIEGSVRFTKPTPISRRSNLLLPGPPALPAHGVRIRRCQAPARPRPGRHAIGKVCVDDGPELPMQRKPMVEAPVQLRRRARQRRWLRRYEPHRDSFKARQKRRRPSIFRIDEPPAAHCEERMHQPFRLNLRC